MTIRHLRTGFLLFAIMPIAVIAAIGQNLSAQTLPRANASDRSHQIESLELQFLATRDPEQRKHFIGKLKAISHSTDDAATLNAAVSAMLPATDSTAQAEELMDIAAANPAGELAGAHSLPDDKEFLIDARRAAHNARHILGDVEALADIRIDRLRKDSLGRDGLTESHVQQLWRINSTQGAHSFSPRSIMYAAMAERLCLVRARVLKHDGSELAATVSADQPVAERSSSMYFDSRTRDLHFAQLEPGDLVEVEYRLLPAADVNPWAGYYARLDPFRDGFATRLRRRVVVAPSGMQLYAVEHGLGSAAVRHQGDQTIRTWEMRDISAEPYEALSPGATASGPYLHVSTIGSMEDFGRWYSALLEPSLKLDEHLQVVASQISERNLTTQGKVQAVYESVQRNTRYVAFEFGVHSYQPYPVITVERRGFGDCKDKAAMIVALLRAVGVPAEFAMVRTRSAGDVAPDAYSVQLFNHSVAYVPDLNIFLDGTAEYAAPGELPPDDQGALAITVDADGRATRRIIPFTPPDANRVTREVQASLSHDGRVDFVAQTRFQGYFASEQRRTSESSESNDLARSYRATLAQFYPSIKIAHAVAEGTARASREVNLKVEGEIEAIDGEREITLRSSLDSAGLTSKFASTTSRRTPELVPVTPSELEVFDYDLPEGAEAVLPANIKLQTPFGRVEVSYQRTGRKLRVETYTELAPLTVSAKDYPAFRAFCTAADAALQREVRIALP
jgi:transglutaminase-like putative cysteine protease